MNCPKKPKVLIVDDEAYICDVLEQTLTRLNIDADSINQPVMALEKIGAIPHDIFLLDIQMPIITGFDLMPIITKQNPNAKIIIMTGYADKEVAIKALQLGAFDFLEKPFQMEILINTVNRAVEAWQKEEQLKMSYEELQSSQKDLLIHKERLELVNSQLIETNRALSILAKSFEREREEMEKRIALRLRTMIVPTIEKLRRDKALSKFESDLNLLVSVVEDLTSGFSTDARVATVLSYTELRIASLVKNGVTTEEIARQLNISPNTVRTHRKNIRKKLKINGQYNLRNFLSCKDGDRSGENGNP